MAQVVCTSCREVLNVGNEQRLHYKSDRHMYNVKRKLENLLPIPADVWAKKLATFERIRQEAPKKQAHLKKDKQRKGRSHTDGRSAGSAQRSWVVVPEDSDEASEAKPPLLAHADTSDSVGESVSACSAIGTSNGNGNGTASASNGELEVEGLGSPSGSSASLTNGFVKLSSDDNLLYTESPKHTSSRSGSPKAKGGLLTKEARKASTTTEGESSSPLLGAANEGHEVREKPLPENPHLRSLFDKEEFETMEANLQYMRSKFSFFIPDSQYCVKKEGLLRFLHGKIINGFTCITCDREFGSEADCRRHMFSKNHTTIGTEGYTNAGNYSTERTDELMAQLEDFYDYSTSYKELFVKDANRRNAGDALAAITEGPAEIDPKTAKTTDAKLEVLLSFFDEDEDNKLNFMEAQEFYRFYSDETEELSYKDYQDFVKACGGVFDTKALKSIYKINKQDDPKVLRQHYTRFLDEWWDEGEDEEGEDLLKEFERVKKGDDDNVQAGAEPSSGSKSSSSKVQAAEEPKKQLKSTRMLRRPIIHEVEDEAEFERLRKAYGLKKASVTPTGNLQLPNGSVATHRDLHYVFRQRGQRADPADLERQRRARKALANPVLRAMGQQGNSQLRDFMIENDCSDPKEALHVLKMNEMAMLKDGEAGKPAAGESGETAVAVASDAASSVALSTASRVAYGQMFREVKKQQREVVIALRRAQKHEMQRGVKQNVLQRGQMKVFQMTLQ